jgi:hypothetical protein
MYWRVSLHTGRSPLLKQGGAGLQSSGGAGTQKCCRPLVPSHPRNLRLAAALRRPPSRRVEFTPTLSVGAAPLCPSALKNSGAGLGPCSSCLELTLHGDVRSAQNTLTGANTANSAKRVALEGRGGTCPEPSRGNPAINDGAQCGVCIPDASAERSTFCACLAARWRAGSQVYPEPAEWAQSATRRCSSAATFAAHSAAPLCPSALKNSGFGFGVRSSYLELSCTAVFGLLFFTTILYDRRRSLRCEPRIAKPPSF